MPVKQSVQVTFSGGLDNKSDPKQVAPAQFLSLSDMVFNVGGALAKRNGFPSLGKTINTPSYTLTYSNLGGSLTNARKLFAYNNELLLSDAFNLYSYDKASDSWNYKGRQTQVALSTASVVSDSNTYVSADSSVDTATGVKVFAFYNLSASTVYFSIQDIVTGQFIVNRQAFGGTSGYGFPRCVSIAGKSWVVALNLSDGKLYYQAIVGQAITGTPTAFVSNLHAAPNQMFDIDVDAVSGGIYIAYYSTSGVTISAISTSFVVGNTITASSEAASNGISFFGDGSNIWVAYNNGTATKAFVVNNAVTATVASATVIDNTISSNVNNVTGVWSSTQSSAFIFFDPTTFSGGFTAAAAINFSAVSLSGSTLTPSTAALFMGSVNINSKAFAVSGIPHVMGIYTYPTTVVAPQQAVVQPTHFLLNLYNVTPSMGSTTRTDVIANIAAKVSPDEAAPIHPTTGHIPGVHFASGAWELALLQNSNFAFETEPYDPFYGPTGVIDCKFDFTLSNPDAQNLGNNAIYAGGQVSMYDGASVVEQNFHIYPNGLAVQSIATTGGHMGLSSGASTYSYIFVYEWIDNRGQVHRSFPSPVITPLAAGQNYTFASGTTTGEAILTVPMLRVTDKGGAQVVVNIYRTVANGSVYFLLGSSNTNSFGTVKNDPSINNTTYLDTFGDFDILGNTQLYTTGGQGYFAPPATAALANFKNRALAVPYEGGFNFLYSNKVLANFPAQFVPFFDQNIGSVGGPLVTIFQMDDKIILFKSGKSSGPAIYYMVGQGPAPSGSGNDFTDPQPVAVDVGCVDRASLVLTPDGIMFKSSKGIYLLNRSMQASYIGAPVEAYNQYAVASAQLIPNTTQVRFSLVGAPVGQLVYDYFYQRWATFTTPAAVSDCIFQGQHTFVGSDGTVYQESPGNYFDGVNTPVLMSFVTAWIKLAGLQGYQSFFEFALLAKYISAHQLNLQISYDFSPLSSQTDVITPDSSSVLENWRIFTVKKRCQAFQINFQEVYTGTIGAGLQMSGLNLLVGVRGPMRTFSSAETVG